MKKQQSSGSLCGGVISQSQHERIVKKHGVWADMMSIILPDKQYQKYISFLEKGNEKKAEEIFERYAHSQI